MAQTPTQDQVIQAARALGRPEFTRDEVAEQLGVERSQMKPSWKAAKEAGQVEKVRDADDGKRYFRLTDQ